MGNEIQELQEFAERLKKLGLERTLELLKTIGSSLRMFDAGVGSTEVAINPFQCDPTQVPSGPFKFKGFVVNAVAPGVNLNCSLYLVVGGNVQMPAVFSKVPDTVINDLWTVTIPLAPNTNYLFEVVLNGQPVSVGTPFQKAFFSTGP